MLINGVYIQNQLKTGGGPPHCGQFNRVDWLATLQYESFQTFLLKTNQEASMHFEDTMWI